MSQSSKLSKLILETLERMPRAGLIELWDRLYGTSIYKGARNVTLIRGVAYKLQSRTHGALKSSVSRKLLKLAKGEGVEQSIKSNSTKNKAAKSNIQIGSRLIREWSGRTYEVIVDERRFILNGISHRSLSACAKAITGAHWSGPRFFGVET